MRLYYLNSLCQLIVGLAIHGSEERPPALLRSGGLRGLNTRLANQLICRDARDSQAGRDRGGGRDHCYAKHNLGPT